MIIRQGLGDIPQTSEFCPQNSVLVANRLLDVFDAVVNGNACLVESCLEVSKKLFHITVSFLFSKNED